MPVPLGDTPAHLDKAVHLWEYLLFSWILLRALRPLHLPSSEYLWLAWIFTTSYGMLMELLQALVPWRSADWVDVMFNAAGSALGVWLGRPRTERSA